MFATRPRPRSTSTTVTPPSRGHLELREAIARSLPAPADPEREILVTNGAMHALSLVFRALLDAGDEVIVPTPCYFFAGLVERAGGTFVPVATRAQDCWRWDPEAIEAAVTSRSRVLVLTNPNNPTGYLPTRAELDDLLAVASRHGLTVVADEAYERCIHDGELASAWGAPNVILVRSLGKSLAMPAWRIGFVAAEPPVVDRCLRELEWDVIRVSHVVQRAAAAALDGPQGWLDEFAGRYRRDRDVAHAAVVDHSVLSALLPPATPFLWLKLGPLSSENLVDAGIAVVDGAAFGMPGYARLPFAGAAAVPNELRERLSAVGRLSVRIGVLSDLHCELEPTGSRWINPFEPEQLDGRSTRRSRGSPKQRVDLILVLGDLVQFANPGDLEHAFGRLAAADVAPLATVNGNHDLRLGDEFAASARRHGIRLLYEEPLVLGRRRRHRRRGRRGAGAAAVRRAGGGLGRRPPLVLVASHFPVLSEASRVAAAGLPYAGDLVNRADVEARLLERPRAEARPERPHPRPLLDSRPAAAAVHCWRVDRAAVRRHDRRDRSARPRRPPDGAAARRDRGARSRLQRGRRALALGR